MRNSVNLWFDMLLQRERSCLLIVDVQERLTPVMTDPRRVLHHCTLLLRTAQRLAVPILATEQYPQGLGPTMVDLRSFLPEGSVLSKTQFSAAADLAVLEKVKSLRRDQIVLAGIEAHICVLQTALGLKAEGFNPIVVVDACASRRNESEQMAWSRLRQCGITLVSLEMVIFEWLHQAGTPEFKELSALIK